MKNHRHASRWIWSMGRSVGGNQGKAVFATGYASLRAPSENQMMVKQNARYRNRWRGQAVQ